MEVILPFFALTLVSVVIVGIGYTCIRLWPLLRFVFWPSALIWIGLLVSGTGDFVYARSVSLGGIQTSDVVGWTLLVIAPVIPLLIMEWLRRAWLRKRQNDELQKTRYVLEKLGLQR